MLLSEHNQLLLEEGLAVELTLMMGPPDTTQFSKASGGVFAELLHQTKQVFTLEGLAVELNLMMGHPDTTEFSKVCGGVFTSLYT